MKKQSFLLVAGALIALASCQNNATDTGANQAQIDSAVNARVEELRMQMMMQNDSLINAEAQRRADSMIAAMKGQTSTASGRPSTRPQQPTRNTPKPETIGSGKPKMGDGNNNSNTVGSGKPKMGDGNNNSNSVGSGKPKMGDK